MPNQHFIVSNSMGMLPTSDSNERRVRKTSVTFDGKACIIRI